MSQESGRQVPINWFVSDRIQSQYANNMVIQHAKDEFVFSFFELLPPMLVGSPQDIQEQIDHMHTAHAECVARIVMTPQTAAKLYRALEQNLTNYQKKFGPASPNQSQQ